MKQQTVYYFWMYIIELKLIFLILKYSFTPYTDDQSKISLTFNSNFGRHQLTLKILVALWTSKYNEYCINLITTVSM